MPVAAGWGHPRPTASRLGRGPLDGVYKYLAHFGAVIVIESFVAGSEVEDFAFADGPTHSHASGFGLAIGLGIKAVERNSFRNGKGFAVALDLQFEILHPFANGMVGQFDNDFGGGAVIYVFAPTARCAHEFFEGL